jgi:hypothetical protein
MNRLLNTKTTTIKKTLYIISIVFGLCLLTVSWLPLPSTDVWAQATSSRSVDLSINPPVAYIAVKPGETKRHIITIKQSGVTPLTVSPRLVSFKADGSTGQPLLSYSSEFKHYTLQLPGGVSDTDTFTILPGEQKNIAITFNPPQETTEKEYPLSLVFFTKPLNEIDATGVQPQVTGSIASNIILLVGQSERDRGKLSIEKISPPFLVDSLGGLEFEILAKNTGINATNASGSVVITNWQGKKVAQHYFFPDMILANSTRLLRNIQNSSHIDLATLTSQEIETFIEKLDPEKITPLFSYNPTFLIGPYTITAEIYTNGQTRYQNTQQSQTASVSSVTVVALPYSIIAVSAVLLVGWVIFYTFKARSEE